MGAASPPPPNTQKSISPLTSFKSSMENHQAIVSPPLTSSVLEAHHRAAPLRIGIMASGNGSNFEAIAQAIADKQLNATLQVVIYNNPGAGVVRRAERWNVPTTLLNHREFSSREALDQAIATILHQRKVEWVVMAGWMRRVTAVLIEAFPDRILNIHPSLLPSFPGINAVEQAIAAQVMITGCTVHHVVLEVDSGPIVMQAAVPILPDDTAETLHQRIHRQEHRIYPLAIALASGRAHLGLE